MNECQTGERDRNLMLQFPQELTLILLTWKSWTAFTRFPPGSRTIVRSCFTPVPHNSASVSLQVNNWRIKRSEQPLCPSEPTKHLARGQKGCCREHGSAGSSEARQKAKVVGVKKTWGEFYRNHRGSSLSFNYLQADSFLLQLQAESLRVTPVCAVWSAPSLQLQITIHLPIIGREGGSTLAEHSVMAYLKALTEALRWGQQGNIKE